MEPPTQLTDATLAEVDRVARKALAILSSATLEKRVVIGLSGVPGSGKSTIARLIRIKINELYQNVAPRSPPPALDVPMDGFHFTRAQLAVMADSNTAIHRRGAAFTFDGNRYLELIQALTAYPAALVKAPSFDHAKKDPVDDAIIVSPTVRLVLVEGNYCALNRKPWSCAAALMTELWYVDVSAEVAQKRVALRHLDSKIVANEQEAWERATGTDELNAQDVKENLLPCHEILRPS